MNRFDFTSLRDCTEAYEVANAIFDEVVFTDSSDLDAYNGIDDRGETRDELYEIIGEILHDAEQAMYKTAEQNKERFLKMVRERSAA